MPNPFFKNLFIPFRAVGEVKEVNRQQASVIFLLVGGCVFIALGEENHLGKIMESKSVFLFALIAGPFAGLLAGQIASWMFYKLSEVMAIVDEKCDLVQIRSAIAYTSIPLIVIGLLTALEYVVLGDAIFNKRNVVEYIEGPIWLYYSFEILKLLILVYTVVLQVYVLAKLRDIKWWQVLVVNFVSHLLFSGAAKLLVFGLIALRS